MKVPQGPGLNVLASLRLRYILRTIRRKRPRILAFFRAGKIISREIHHTSDRRRSKKFAHLNIERCDRHAPRCTRPDSWDFRVDPALFPAAPRVAASSALINIRDGNDVPIQVVGPEWLILQARQGCSQKKRDFALVTRSDRARMQSRLHHERQIRGVLAICPGSAIGWEMGAYALRIRTAGVATVGFSREARDDPDTAAVLDGDPGDLIVRWVATTHGEGGWLGGGTAGTRGGCRGGLPHCSRSARSVLVQPAPAQDQVREFKEPILVVETDGHHAPVRSLIWRNEFSLISGGHDKVVRFWDFRDNPRQVRTLRPMLWRGLAGTISPWRCRRSLTSKVSPWSPWRDSGSKAGAVISRSSGYRAWHRRPPERW